MSDQERRKRIGKLMARASEEAILEIIREWSDEVIPGFSSSLEYWLFVRQFRGTFDNAEGLREIVATTPLLDDLEWADEAPDDMLSLFLKGSFKEHMRKDARSRLDLIYLNVTTEL